MSRDHVCHDFAQLVVLCERLDLWHIGEIKERRAVEIMDFREGRIRRGEERKREMLRDLDQNERYNQLVII
jgi:hypothetical protein